MDVGRRPAMVGVASFCGGPPGVPGGQLLLFDFSFEIGYGGSRVAGEAFPFSSFFGSGVRSFVPLDTYVTWYPMYVGLDSSGD